MPLRVSGANIIVGLLFGRRCPYVLDCGTPKYLMWQILLQDGSSLPGSTQPE